MKETETIATPLELLAPAKNLLQGKEAILHGADAVYIGAPAFGARAAVPVSLEEIAELIDFAHLYQARVYVALNTILYDEEVPQAVDLAHQLYDIGVDALIIQDFALLHETLPPIELHASTQMDNVTAERVGFLRSQGIAQVVLPREFTPTQTDRLHRQVPDIRLEAFIHGALCVSYSGRCFAAAAFHGRSANRGSCSQVCRLPFTMTDGRGQTLVRDQHLLSIKDLNRADYLPQLIEAGVTSFKIEGRLKGIAYVKQTTAYYHQKLNDFIAHHQGYRRSSYGDVALDFMPDVTKVFNRGFTPLVQQARQEDRVAAFATPKFVGKEVGKVQRIAGRQLTLKLLSDVTLHNGDGLVFYLPDMKGIKGFRVNSVKGRGEQLELTEVPREIKRGTTLYRNYDLHFEKSMQAKSATRSLPVNFKVYTEQGHLVLQMEVLSSRATVTNSEEVALEPIQKGDTRESITTTLGKLGNTVYRLNKIDIAPELPHLFIPRSLLTKMRQSVTQLMDDHLHTIALESRGVRPTSDTEAPFYTTEVGYQGNVLNHSARAFLEQHGAEVTEWAYEAKPQKEQPIMYTKHCIRYSLHQCPHLQGYKEPHHEPWRLHYIAPDPSKSLTMRLHFNCAKCQMELYKES